RSEMVVLDNPGISNMARVIRVSEDGSPRIDYAVGTDSAVDQPPAVIDLDGDGRPELILEEQYLNGARVYHFSCAAEIVRRQADLGLPWSGPSAVSVGATATFNAVIRNNGPDAAPRVAFQPIVPDGVTIVALSASRGDCTLGPPGRCDFGVLEPNGTVDIA